MNKEKIKECIQLTDDILTGHFNGKHVPVEKHIHKDCLWIGSLDSEYVQGKNAIMEKLDVVTKELPKVNLSSKEFVCVMNDRTSCVVAGRYYGVTDESSGQLYRDMQRITFAWKEENNQLWLMHMHVSNPLNNVEEGETFPHQIGKFTKEYLEMLIKKEIERTGFINVKDKDYAIHNIQISNIIYLEAFNMNTLIHTINGDIFARSLISDLENEINHIQKNIFIRIHKSFCVNKYYVTSLKRYEVCMVNEFNAPISRDKYIEIREQLHL